MPKGVPKAGFRLTKGRVSSGNFPTNTIQNIQSLLAKAPRPATNNLPPVVMTKETDEQIADRINGRFDVMNLMVEMTVDGKNRAVIISGPPGLGKTWNTERIVKSAEEIKNVSSTMISGFVRATGLYQTLYEYRHKNCVVIFDDADSIFFDDVSLNILKKACDTTSTRRLSWLAETKMEDEGGERLPRDFEFEGAIIFITNYDFDAMIAKGHKLAPHLEAMISRAHYLDLSIKNRRDYMVRIRQVVDSGMLREEGYMPITDMEVMDYMERNQDRLREISLRMVLKLATLTTIKSSAGWRKVADATCLR